MADNVGFQCYFGVFVGEEEAIFVICGCYNLSKYLALMRFSKCSDFWTRGWQIKKT